MDDDGYTALWLVVDLLTSFLIVQVAFALHLVWFGLGWALGGVALVWFVFAWFGAVPRAPAANKAGVVLTNRFFHTLVAATTHFGHLVGTCIFAV